jgi:hypothetical protein
MEVGDVVAGVTTAVGLQGGLACVEGVADGAVADRVHVDLEAVRVEGREGLGKLVVVDVADSALIRLVTRGVAVGTEQGPGVVLEDPIGHDLHGHGMEGGRRSAVTASHELVDLLEAPVPIPPEGADDANGQVTPLGRERYASSVAGVTHASCQPVMPSECGCVCARRIARSHSSRGGAGRCSSANEYAAPSCRCRWARPSRGHARSDRPTGRASLA